MKTLTCSISALPCSVSRLCNPLVYSRPQVFESMDANTAPNTQSNSNWGTRSESYHCVSAEEKGFGGGSLPLGVLLHRPHQLEQHNNRMDEVILLSLLSPRYRNSSTEI